MAIRKIDLMHEQFGKSENLCKECAHFGRWIVGDKKTVKMFQGDSQNKYYQFEVVNRLRDIPAADVRPVVRGKWVDYGDEYRPDIKCCMCGQKKSILLGNFNFNFCPNCGADMRGGDAE